VSSLALLTSSPIVEIFPHGRDRRIAAGRTPASPGFLARRLLAAGWTDDAPEPWPVRQVVELCRAEIDWSVAEWRRLDPLDNEDTGGWGPHPSELYRLPHEHDAARVLNAAAHLQPTRWRLHELVRSGGRLRAQRRAAADGEQSETCRLDWMQRAADTVEEIETLWALRRRQMHALAHALAAYRRARGTLDTAARHAA